MDEKLGLVVLFELQIDQNTKIRHEDNKAAKSTQRDDTNVYFLLTNSTKPFYFVLGSELQSSHQLCRLNRRSRPHLCPRVRARASSATAPSAAPSNQRVESLLTPHVPSGGRHVKPEGTPTPTAAASSGFTVLSRTWWEMTSWSLSRKRISPYST